MANRFDDKVASVTKALVILEELSREPEGLGLLELSSRVEMHKTTVYRLLTSLLEKDFVEQDHISGHYSLGLKILSLASAFYQKLDIRAVIRGQMGELPQELEGFFLIIKRTGKEYVIIDCIPKGVEPEVKPGQVMSAEEAAGKIFCANTPVWQRHEKELGFAGQKTAARMKKEMQNISLQGYVYEEKGSLGIPCIAVPIFDFSKNIVCTVSLYSEALRNKKKQSELILWLMDAADRISAQLGFVRFL